jgi:hypothetical protein
MAILKNPLIRNLAFALLMILDVGAAGGRPSLGGMEAIRHRSNHHIPGGEFPGVPLGSYDFGGAIGVQSSRATGPHKGQRPLPQNNRNRLADGGQDLLKRGA